MRANNGTERLGLATLAVVAGILLGARGVAAHVPSQWVAKVTTAATGAAPTAPGWQWGAAYFGALGCNAESLKILGSAVFKGPAFVGLPYDNASRMLALYRGALNTELRSIDVAFFLGALNNGSLPWNQFVDAIFASQAFLNLVPQICSTQDPDYGFGDQPAGDLKQWAGQGASRTQSALQAALDAAQPGCGAVALAPREVVVVGASGPLRVPACVTLETLGLPGPPHYARMGRIVSAASVCDNWNCHGRGLVELGDGSVLRNVWVDGNGADDGNAALSLVRVASGVASTAVTDCQLSDSPPGGASIKLDGWSQTQIACSNRSLSGNLITAYGRADDQTGLGAPLWTSGIAVHCEDALIESNELVDVSGVGISLKGSWNSAVGNGGLDGRRAQVSVARQNTIISAGANGLIGLEADPVGACLAEDSGAEVPCIEFNDARDDFPALVPLRDFAGASFEDNAIWTGPQTHFDVGIMVGGFARFALNTPLASGMSITGNNSGGLSARVQTGVLIAGMLNTNFVGNDTSAMTIVSGGSHWDGGCASGAAVAGFYLANFTPGSDPVTVVSPYDTFGCLIPTPPSAGREAIAVANAALEGSESGDPFVAWGHNHSLDHSEDPVELLQLRHVGTNAVRVHPQFRDLMDANCLPNTNALAELLATADAAAEVGIYLDVTGLGSFAGDPSDPACYRNANEETRWNLQAAFWSAVASTLRDHPAVLMFDLMNEPLAPAFQPPGGQCWTGDPALSAPLPPGCYPDLVGFYFVQNITREPLIDANATGNAWLGQLTGAIRAQDSDRLISLGCLPFSNCAIGVQPAELANHLDILSVHIYPADCTAAGNGGVPCSPYLGGTEPPGQPLLYEHGLVATFGAAGKPVIVEEIFPLGGSSALVSQFISEATSAGTVSGWFGQWEDGTSLSDQRIAPSPHYPDLFPAPYAWYDWGRLFQNLTPEIAACGSCGNY